MFRQVLPTRELVTHTQDIIVHKFAHAHTQRESH